jgi:V8-like Glu-specific endopeptidase
MAMLDQAPYPVHEPLARELHLVLSQLYPASRAAVHVASRAGADTGNVFPEQGPYPLWRDLLDDLARQGMLRPVVELAAQEFPRSPHHAFLKKMLAGQAPARDPEPRAQDGTPAFKLGDDAVTEQEALLFRDDLTLPSGRMPGLIATLQRLVDLSPAVCRLEVSTPQGAASGTGFRVGADLLLTNWHVAFPSGQQAVAITATFGYEEDATGVGMAGTAVGCQVTGIQGEQAADWAVLKAQAPLPATPVLPISHGVQARLHASAFVVQHPRGQRKRIAYARNKITACNEEVVQYLSDTEPGSSGSPVFDEDGRVVALHHAGGRPQEVPGQPPVQKNEGIAIGRVVKGMQQFGITL